MQTRFRFRVLSALGALVTALLLVVPSLEAQAGTVTGRVVNTSGEPVAAAQVFISSLDLGSLTQQNGRYLIPNVPAGTHTLSVTRIGYRTVEAQITIGGGQTVEQNFSVAEEALQLDAIIVTGTPGGTARRAIGNAVVTIDAAAITAQVPITSMQQMLSARTPGLNFTRTSGILGSGSAINIRGFSSIAIGNQPLIYVDGIRVDNSFGLGPDNQWAGLRDSSGSGGSALDDINPNDIESIEIIKGPAAATLYGTEASAGVIQIITKKGVVGAPEFSLTVRQGQNFMINPAGQIGTQYGCRAGRNLFSGNAAAGRSMRPCFRDQMIAFNIYDYHAGLITDRNPEVVSPNSPRNLLSNGYSQTYNLGVSGGTETVRYFLSADYFDAVGIVDYNTQVRVNLRTNIDIVFSDDLSIAFRASYQEGETSFAQQYRNTTVGGIWSELIYAQANHLVHDLNDPDNLCDAPPTDTFFEGPNCNAPHQPQSEFGDADGFVARDPKWYKDVESIRDYSRFTTSVTATHTVGDWLNQRLTFGVDNSWTENSYTLPRGAGRINFPFPESDGEISVSQPFASRFSFDYSASGIYNMNNVFQFVTSAGIQYNTSTRTTFRSSGEGLPNQAFTSLSNLTNFDFPSHILIQDKSLGFFVQEQIGINNRLFFTAAVRADDNSAFGSDFQRKYYPKLSGTWSVSEESFWNFDFINELRVRSAWGRAGRQPGAFDRFFQYGVAVGPGGSPAIRLNAGGNLDVGPETSTEWEGGFDIAFLDDRVFGEFTYFKQWVSDALVPQALSPSESFTGNVTSNLGALENWGWEASFDVSIVDGNSFGASLRLSGDHTANKLTKLDDAVLDDENFREGWFYPNVVSYTMDSARFADPTDITSEVFAWCDFGDPLTGDGLGRGGPSVPCSVAQSADQQLMWGAAFPSFTWTIAPTLRFLQNQLEVFALVEGQYGRWLANLDTDFRSGLTGGQNAYQGWVRDDIEFLGARSVADDERWTGRFNADFWKLREVGARYQLPQSLTGALNVDRASISFSASNLLTIWRRQWLDFSGVRIADVESVQPFSGEPNFSFSQFPGVAAYSFVLRISF